MIAQSLYYVHESLTAFIGSNGASVPNGDSLRLALSEAQYGFALGYVTAQRRTLASMGFEVEFYEQEAEMITIKAPCGTQVCIYPKSESAWKARLKRV